MAQTHLAAQALLKQKYGPGIHDQLSNEAIPFGMFKKVGKERWGGAAFFHSLRTGRNRNMRPGGEQTALPASGRQTYANSQVACRIYHGTGGFTAFGAAATEMSDAAFGEMVKTEVDGLISDSRKDLNIDTYGTPLGVLGRIAAGGIAGAVATLEQLDNVVAWRTFGNRYFSPNQNVDIVDELTGLVNDTDTVLSVSAVNRTDITQGNAIAGAAAAGDLYVRTGTQGAQGVAAAPAFRALDGLEFMIDDDTTTAAAGNAMGLDLSVLHAINRTTAGNEYFRGNVLNLAGAALTETDIQNLVYRIEERSGLYPDVFLTHRSVQFAIQQLMVGDRRFVPQEFPGGFKAESLVYNAGDRDIPIVVSRECPYRRLYALNLDAIHCYMLRDVELIEEDGSVLRQDATGGDEWDFSWRAFFNIGTTQPNALGKMVRIGGADEAFGIGAARVYDF